MLIENEFSSISQSGGSRVGGSVSVGVADIGEGSVVCVADRTGGGFIVIVGVLGAVEDEQAAARTRMQNIYGSANQRRKGRKLDSLV